MKTRQHFLYILMPFMVSALMFFFATAAEARYTRAGIPASESYVRSNNKKRIIIFVGDSRAMRMTISQEKAKARDNFAFAFVTGGNVTVIDKNGCLTPYVKRLIKKYRKRNPVIVFNLGVNGNGNVRYNAKRIIRIYRWWMKKYPRLQFVVESVNPTLVSSGSYANKKVKKLNKLLKAEFEPDGIWMDTYNPMIKKKMIKKNGYGMVDGLHYNWSAGKKLLKYIRRWTEENAA